MDPLPLSQPEPKPRFSFKLVTLIFIVAVPVSLLVYKASLARICPTAPGYPSFARNIFTGEEKDFINPCVIPLWWRTIIPDVIYSPQTQADWQIYRNEKYGFEFSYPQDLELTEHLIEDVDMTPEDPTDKTFDYLEVNLHDKRDRQIFNFNLSMNHPGMGFESWNVVSESKVSIGGIEADKVIFEQEGGHEAGLRLADYTFRKDADRGFGVTASGDYEKADEILSTFRFFEPIDISNWKVYRNEEYGFEVKYPNDWYFKNCFGYEIVFADSPAVNNCAGSVRRGPISISLHAPSTASERNAIEEEFFIQVKNRPSQNMVRSDIFVGGKSAIKLTPPVGISVGTYGYTSTVFLFLRDRIFEINYFTLAPEDKDYSDIFNQMIGTIKFTK